MNQQQLLLDPAVRLHDGDSSDSSSNSGHARQRGQNRLPYQKAGDSSEFGSFPLPLDLHSSDIPGWIALSSLKNLRRFLVLLSPICKGPLGGTMPVPALILRLLTVREGRSSLLH